MPLTTHDLKQFTGDLQRFGSPLHRPVIWSPGVNYVAEQAGAFWLIDAIASHIKHGSELKAAAKEDERLQSLQFWALEVNLGEQSAVLTCQADTGCKPAARQVIEYTDFPLEKIDIWAGYDGTHWTLYLPSEH